MTKKVLMIQRNGNWDKATEWDLRNEAQGLNEFVSRMKLKFVVNYLFAMQWRTGDSRLRFADITKCRESSYLPFNRTTAYFEAIEQDAEERGMLPC